MVDANLLKQLEDSLNAYQENQETLDTVVRVAQSALGSSWINQLPTVFDDASMPEEQKKLVDVVVSMPNNGDESGESGSPGESHLYRKWRFWKN